MAPNQPDLQLLHTKLLIPRTHPEIIERATLLRRVESGLDSRLLLVTAPAGYGKTTLLSNLIRQNDIPAAWISLDERDNDPRRFWAYLIAALQTLDPALGTSAQLMLQSPQTPPIDSILESLINGINGMSGDFFLVLDDYHFISNATIHENITFLVENLPNQMHLLVSSRSEPALPLASLRARRQMVEIKATDLRFSKAEVEQFLNQLMNLDLSTAEIDAIEDLTEGWAAGIQLAALSLQGDRSTSEQLKEFSANHHFIFDYLAQEVLSKQPPEIQEFLIHTSILDQLCGSLCDEVLESAAESGDRIQNSSQAILDYLEKHNLFIVSLDQQRQWYRYHNLFADFLRTQFSKQSEPELEKKLHRRASSWFKKKNMLLEAIEHALNSGDYQEVGFLIDNQAEELFNRSELHTLSNWLEKLPLNVYHAIPRLNMIAAWAYLALGQSQLVETHLKIVEEILKVNADGSAESLSLPPETRGILAEISCIRITLAINMVNFPLATLQSRQTLDYLGDDAQAGLFNNRRDLLAVTHFNRGILSELKGEIQEASEAFSKSIDLNENNLHLITMAISHLAHLQELQGQLKNAEKTFRMAKKVTDNYPYPLPLSGLADIGLGNLLCERNQLKNAQEHLLDGIELGNIWKHGEVLTTGYMVLARVAMALGEDQQANQLLEKAIENVRGIRDWQTPLVDAYRVQIWARQGDLEAISSWSQNCQIDPRGPIEFNQEQVAIALIRVLISLERYSEARQLCAKLIAANESRSAWGQVIQLLVFDFLAAHAQGETMQAVDGISRALALAAPEGYVRIFLDEGEAMYSVLEAVEKEMPADTQVQIRDYLMSLLQEFKSAGDYLGHSLIHPSISSDPLSDREIEVLKLLERGLSNQQIAEELFISTNTVKAHLKNIYGKLGVNNRVQAISKGRQAGF